MDPAQPRRPRTAHQISRQQHLQRPGVPHQPRHPRRTPEARQEPHQDLGLTEQRFLRRVSEHRSLALSGYEDLYRWSIRRPAEFWAEVWNFCGIVHSRGYGEVVDDPSIMPDARWFPGARLNFAENLLRHRDVRPAILFQGGLVCTLANPEALAHFVDWTELRG